MKTIISNGRLAILYWLVFNFFLTASFQSQAGMDFVDFVQDGQGRIEGLAGASSVAMSRDDKFVYVASSVDNTITVLIRNPMTGGVVPIQVIRDNTGNVDGLDGATSVTVSVDNQSVYVASFIDGAVAVFKRDLSTGQLTFQQVLKDGQDGVDVLLGAASVTVSADGQSVYVASTIDRAVAVFKRNPSTGQLTFQQVLKNGQDGVIGSARSVTVSTDDQSVYVASHNMVAVFARDKATGLLTFQQVLKSGQDGVDGLGGARSITVSADDQSVYVAGSNDGAVAVFARDKATGLLIFQQVLKNGQDGVDGLLSVASVTVSTDDQSVYVASYEGVAIFGRNKDSGELTFRQILKDGQPMVDGLDGATSVTMSADDQSVYVASSLDNAVVVFKRDKVTGLLIFQQILKTGQDGVDWLIGDVFSVTVSADDQSVYVTSQGNSAMVVFKRDKDTGQLTFQQILKDGEDGVDGLYDVRSVTVSTDNQSVYVVSPNDSSVAVFARDKTTGFLTWQQILRDGQDGVDGLSSATSVTVSADGQSVYVASGDDSAVAVFGRDPNTGLLTFKQVIKDGASGVDGFASASSVTVSADGKSVYVASFWDNAVAVFARNLSTGLLSFQRTIKDGEDGVNGLAQASSVAISRDDRFVYVASQKDDAIAIFDRTNKAPVNTLPAAPTLNKNTSLTLEQLRIADEDANPLPVKVTLIATQGTLTLSTTTDLTFEQGDGTDDPQLVMTGTVAAINKALKGMIFKPTPNFSGEATLQITTNDLGNVGYGGAKQDTDTLKINVLPVNAAPTLEKLETQYGSPTKLLSFPVKATDPDVPKQNLTYALLNNPPAGATLDSKTGQFNWTPLPNQIGSFDLTIQVTDDGKNPDNLTATQTVNIIITEAPVLEPIAAQTVTVGSTLTFAAEAHFPGTQALSFSLKEAPNGAQINAKTGVFTWTPTQTGNFTATVVVTEPVGNKPAKATVAITVIAIPTSLELDLNSFAIFLDNKDLIAKGWLKAYAPQAVNLQGLPIKLQITAPDGSQATPITVNTTANGEYQFTALAVFNQIGQYRLQAQFAGNESLAASQSTSLPLTVESLAGYALLVQGRDAQGNGQEAYGKSLNRVYQQLKNRGFVDPNIDYLSYNDDSVGVDDHPDKAKVQTALQALQTRMNSDPAPLYIVAVDHGDLEGNFYLDNGNGEKITPTELDNWLTTLEQGLNAEAKKQPRVIIIGSCYSGNFIPTLSKSGRTIITSTAADEASYKGPKEPDEVRSGEYFIEALFAQFGQGQSLKTAFELATQSTELFTRASDTTVFNNQFQDNAMQHPLLDDDGNRQGSNVLSTDGQVAKTIYLGLGKRYDKTAKDNPAEIWSVTPTIHLGANQTSTRLWARVNRPNRVKGQQVLVDIRPPMVQLSTGGTEQRESQEIEGLKRLSLNFVSSNEFGGSFDGFTQVGRYELLYFVIDSETGARSPLQSSLVYKDRAGNHPPPPVQLLQPKDHSEQATTVIFNWQKSTDPDGDSLTYTFLLATEPTFQKIIYQQVGLITAMTYLNADSVIDDPLNQGQPGLRDGTDYAWKVQAIDQYGATSESPVFTFRTNDTNLPPGLGSLYVYNAVDFVSLENAILDFWLTDENGNLILDPNGLPIPTPEVYRDQGVYNMMLPYGRRRPATIRVEGYQDKEVIIDATDGLANLQVAMTPIGSIPVQAGQLQFAIEQVKIDETQSEVTLLVNRVEGKEGTVSVSYELLPTGSASLGSDYNLQTGQLTWINQDRSPKKIPIIIHDDDQAEGEETFALRLNNPTGNATLGTLTEVTITLIDDETMQPQQPGVLQFLTTHYAASESDSKPVVTVTRTGGSEGQVSVQYFVTNESTAQFNTDYTGGTGMLTWANGDDEPKRLQITLIDDTAVEELETLHFMLVNPTKGATLGEHQSATLTITDNDVAGVGAGSVQFAQSAYQAHEEEGSLKTVTVIRTGGNQGQVSVQYQIAAESTATAGSDYTLADTDLLTWEAGDNEAKIIKITIADDPEIEAAETIQFRLLNPSGGVILGNPMQATLTISDNDQTSNDPTSEDKPTKPAGNEPIDPTGKPTPIDEPGNPPTTLITPEISIDPDIHSDSTTTAGTFGTLQFFTNTYYLNEGIDSVKTFTVTRSGGSQGAVSVEYTTIGGTAKMGLDYIDGTGLLTWADGDDTPKAIDLTVLDDQEAEKAETIQLQLQDPTGNAQLGIDARATLIIADNEMPPTETTTAQAELEFTSPLYWVQEEDKTAQLTVTRAGSDQGEVSVQYFATVNSSATLGEDYQNGSGTLVWAEGDTQPQTITLELNDDNLPEEEIIHFLLTQPTGAAALGKLSETIVVIKDKDSSTDPVITLSPTTVQFTTVFARVAEPDKEVLIPVIRTGTQGYAAVDYETIAGSATVDEDYLPRQGHLVWQDGEEGVVDLIIPIVTDYRGEAEKSFTLRLFNPSESVQLGKLSQVEIRIQNQEPQPWPRLLPNLGRGMALVNSPSTHWKTSFNCQAFPCPLNAAFYGGSSLNGLSYHSQLTLNPYQYVNIRGKINVAAEHVGQSAELLVVAAWKPLDSIEPERYFMQDNQGQILPWDLNLAHLVAAQEAVTLTPTQEIYLYTGFLESGQIRLFFGYQLPDGVIVFNGEQAIELVVEKLGGN